MKSTMKNATDAVTHRKLAGNCGEKTARMKMK